MLGFCNQTQMPAVYAAADCLVLPSDGHETWGLVANEALASGRPVVVSDACGCAPDLLRHNGAGRSFPLGDIGALSRAIQEVLTHPPSAKEISVVSRAYDLRSAAEGVAAALKYLLHSRRRA